MPFKLHQSVWRGKAKVHVQICFFSKRCFILVSRWAFGIVRCLCMFGKGWGKQKRAEKQSMLRPSFLVFSFASYTIFFQRNLQAIKCIRAQAAFARSWAECSAGAHLPAGSVTPFQCCTCRKLLLSLCLTGQVNTMLGLIQQLWAVKGSDPPPSPALEQGLSTRMREHASFIISFFFFGQVIFWLWFPSQFTAEAHTGKQG